MFYLSHYRDCQELRFWLIPAVYYCSHSFALSGKHRQRWPEPLTYQPRLPLMPQLFDLASPWSFPSVQVPTTRHISPRGPSGLCLCSWSWSIHISSGTQAEPVYLFGLGCIILPVCRSPPCPFSQQASCFIPGSVAAPDCGAPCKQGASPRTGDRVSDAQASQQVRGQLLLVLIFLDEEAANHDHLVQLVPRADEQDKAH